MRLINNLDIQAFHPEEVLVLIRHGVDVSVLDNNLNQPLTEQTKPDIRLLGKQLIWLCESLGVTNICLRHSNRLRAIQTTAIIAEEFFDANLLVEMVETIGVREIYQGDFVVRNHAHGTDYRPLVDAWDAWQAKLNACELCYRFGDPVSLQNGGYEFPELVGWFNKFGENQGEFSLRLYQTLFDTLSSDPNKLQVLVGHQASCSRIQRILSSTSKLSNKSAFEAGEFVRFIEKSGTRISIDHACGVVVKKPRRDLILSVLEKEINFLNSNTWHEVVL